MNLTEQQLASFKEKYANVIVNNMTLKECQELIFNQICNDFDDMSFDEIVEESVNHGEADCFTKLTSEQEDWLSC